MKYMDAIRALASHRTNEVVITSGGNSCQAWWMATGDTEGTFYLDASLSLSTMFGCGLALARPDLKVWAFMGDGAFCMNSGMLMVEKQLNLPNLTHILLSNRVWGATSNSPLPNAPHNDYAAIARAMGLERVFEFGDLAALQEGFAALNSANAPGHTFIALEVEPFSDAEQRELKQTPMDGAELKYRFGRHVEKLTDCNIFGYRI
jgi:thiamine pyrophosphate-dependent acetolactate synthase large subunit-like protein